MKISKDELKILSKQVLDEVEYRPPLYKNVFIPVWDKMTMSNAISNYIEGIAVNWQRKLVEAYYLWKEYEKD